MVKLNSLLLSSEEPKRLVDFYRQLLGREPSWQEGEYSGFDGAGFTLVIAAHSKVHGQTKNPERIIFNFETGDVKGEFDRMKKLGAKVIAEPYTMEDNQDFWIATLADPDGNYFQLVSPMKN